MPADEPTLSVYEERADCGLYDELADTLAAMGVKALGNVDCPDDFVRHQTGGHSSNIEFRDNEGFEFRALIVGEVAGTAHGTVMRATGNYYAAADFKPIDDTKLTVKDILALSMPTCATTRLANFYENQTVPLRAAIDHEFGIESAAEPFEEFSIRPWLRSTDEQSQQDDLIMCHMLPKYGIPASAGAGTSTPARRGKRKLDEENPRSASAVVTPGQSFTVTAAPPIVGPNVPVPGVEDVKLGAFYDPRLLPDYGGPYFKQVKAKLVQLDVRDGTEGGNNALIPPYQFYDRLKLGTLVLVNASLHIFVMPETDGKGAQRGRRRKVYQINAHSIKVLADSDAPIEPRSVMIPRNYEGAYNIPVPAPPEFANFSLKSSPTKGKAAAVASKIQLSNAAASSTTGSRAPVASAQVAGAQVASAQVASGSGSSTHVHDEDDDMGLQKRDHKKFKKTSTAAKA